MIQFQENAQTEAMTKDEQALFHSTLPVTIGGLKEKVYNN